MSECIQEVKRARRFYLLKRLAAVQQDELGLSLVWRAKQEAELGTSLPSDFPQRAALALQGYTTVEDIDGANTDELTDAGLTLVQAAQVLAALEPLT